MGPTDQQQLLECHSNICTVKCLEIITGMFVEKGLPHSPQTTYQRGALMPSSQFKKPS